MISIDFSSTEVKSLLTFYLNELEQLSERSAEVGRIIKLLQKQTKGGKGLKLPKVKAEKAGGKRKYTRKNSGKPTWSSTLLDIIKSAGYALTVDELVAAVAKHENYKGSDPKKAKSLVTQTLFKMKKEGSIKAYKQAGSRIKLYGTSSVKPKEGVAVAAGKRGPKPKAKAAKKTGTGKRGRPRKNPEAAAPKAAKKVAKKASKKATKKADNPVAKKGPKKAAKVTKPKAVKVVKPVAKAAKGKTTKKAAKAAPVKVVNVEAPVVEATSSTVDNAQ